MSPREIVKTSKAPDAIGPYSQAVKINKMVFLSGQIAIDPKTQQFVDGDIETQTKRALDNLKAVVEAAGSGLESVVKTTIYLTDINDFSKVNEIYASYFSTGKPARSTVCVSALPKNAKIEIDAIAEII
ncbi:MAG: RidA family protein [Euryarchaeota archaeon]|nr:RidA family protein [Euryarchaeota archaeon]MBU4453726.1 RidA family protein [Euryarchaeota archaeon]MDP3103711.1 RidA family protein [Candidatus Methanoperedens sp.]